MKDWTGPSLFDTTDIWLAAPLEAFSAWLVSNEFALNKKGEPQPLRESSIKVYRAMFAKFVGQVLPPDGSTAVRTLPQVTAADIQAFLDRNELKKGIRHRYIRLLERTYDLLGSKGLVDRNPARGLALRQPAALGQANDRTMWLTPLQQEAVVSALPQGDTWKARRNRALIATVLGGGLKLSEVIGLTLGNVGQAQEDGSLPIDVYPGGAGRWHRTRLTPLAATILAGWLEERVALPIPGEQLFPAGPAGGTLHPATVYRQVAAVLAAAGIPGDLIKRRGARTLRNTFAVRELAEGSPPDLVGEYLGHRADRSTRYYTDLLPKTPKK